VIRCPCGALLGALLGACGPTPAADPASAPIDAAVAPAQASDDPTEAVRARLQAYEDRRRSEIELERGLQPWSASAGDDPFALVRLDDAHVVGALRGADALVLLDTQGRELDRLATPVRPSAVALGPAGDIVAVGEAGAELVHARRRGERLELVRTYPVPRTVALRDVVVGEHTVWLADRDRGELFAMPWTSRHGLGPARTELDRCRGAAALERAGNLLVAVCVLDRSLWLGELGDDGRSTLRKTTLVNDGPWWSVSALADADGRWVAGGGVEDRALDRSDGSFGWVDSHVFVHRITRCGEALCSERRAAIDVGEHGVVTPKWLGLAKSGDGFTVTVTGYGAPAMVELALDREGKPTGVRTREVVPGLRELVATKEGWLGADPLLDAWVAIDGEHVELAHAKPVQDPKVRLGEALFFTSLLAPHAKSDGRSSRFTCETCHFEGGVDGRVHYTGRADVHAATKPLFGLFRNRPHFSRALDRTIAVMVDNEFAVANRGSDVGPYFAIDDTQTPWVRQLGVTGERDPDALREAFIEFLVAFEHEPNPRTRGRTQLDAREQEGMALFQQHCERCHEARLQTDDPATRVPPQRWAELVLSPTGPIVWATEQRMQTGIVPLVHPEGARVTALRRLAQKHPYFTNGSADDLDAVLARVVLAPEFAHDGDGSAPALDADERAALRAFLELL
jgi:hypothetical protein